jgi:6-phosphogluconolactonase (cycloisomerase 2 family)
MGKRFTWVLAVAALVSAGALVACSSKYKSSDNGLVVVATQGSTVMDTYSLDLGSGRLTQINNAAGPPTKGIPTSVVLDPAGTFAYVLVTQSTFVPESQTGVETFPLGSDGKLGAGTVTTLMGGVQPTAMAIDSAGKFLFIADATPGAVSVLSISGGTLTEVANSPFLLQAQTGGQLPSASALAISNTVYPSAYAICSANVPPTTENLYVTDAANYEVLNYSVGSTGALTFVSQNATGTVPSGVTVDPCNRFVYVSNAQPNDSVSAFTVCNAVNLAQLCSTADFSLQPVTGSPFVAGNNPGPLMMDPQAKFLYVLNTTGNSISGYSVSSTTGSLTPIAPTPIATNSFPTAMAIRSDDMWLFVTNENSANISEYAITPSSGALTPQTPISTDNLPWGIAVR